MAVLFVALLASGFGRVVQNICIGSTFAARVPGPLRSRVRGTFQMISMGTRALGALAGGTLGEIIGSRPTLWVAAIGGTLAVLLPGRSELLDHHNPLRRGRRGGR